ncbi:hypothetical protein [Anabaena subtropica]|uniref:Uncharacterized protein n=1 Tax=Anabaena subtropica FACHB-260 TaxID=2692884 RepID=A0ABR8CKN7_9NOST|nr:hypothetical protein [Anabaena subtropica]MBD2343403.1 hypothetical protein [Anabaena subtropica FACHB-260]
MSSTQPKPNPFPTREEAKKLQLGTQLIYCCTANCESTSSLGSLSDR